MSDKEDSAMLLKFALQDRESKLARVKLVSGVPTYVNEDKVDEAYRKLRKKFQQWMLPENLIVLSGAGTSIVLGNDGKDLDSNGKRYTGKSVWKIWLVVKDGAQDIDIPTLLKQFDLYDEKEKKESDNFNLEILLSKLETFVSANQNSSEETMKKLVGDCENLKKVIVDTLKIECELLLHDTAPHPNMLRTILSARKRSQSRLKIFTLNYDTLFEQAAERVNATIIDGFSFTRTPTFNGSNYDLDVVRRERSRIHHQENYEEKVFHLYKMHGSLDWERANDKVVRRQDFTAEPLIIPPSAHKFEQSYEMPFFEMMSRFQQVLRKENTVLLIIGYSFGDGHINRVIIEALESNLNFEVIIVSPTITKDSNNETVKKLHQKIDSGQTNITLIGDTFQRFTQAMPTIVFSDDEDGTKSPEATVNKEETINNVDIPF